MADDKTAAAPKNIRVLYVGPGLNQVKPGDIFSSASLAALGINPSDLLSRGDAELTDLAATVEIDITEKPAA